MKCIYLAIFLLLTSCSKTTKSEDCALTTLLQDRIGQDVPWHADCSIKEECIQALLEGPLSLDNAIQIALINNFEIQAALEDIGIAQADLLEAGLLPNLFFDGFIRYPDEKNNHINTQISVLQNIVDFLLIPIRTRVATAELAQARLKTARTILDITFSIEETYYQLIAAQAEKHLLASIQDAAEAEHELAMAQKEAANINELELYLRRDDAFKMSAELIKTDLEIVELREKMNALLGLYQCHSNWQTPLTLPSIPPCEQELDCLESIAFEERLDLQIARWEVEKLARFYPSQQPWMLTDLKLGVSSEHETSGVQVTGPQISGELPLFNNGQAKRARLRAQYRQALDRLIALGIQAYAEVREAQEKLLIRRHLVLHYQSRLLPNQENIVDAAQRLYNVMGLGVYDLLNLKRNEIQAHIDYGKALKEYWLARVNLNRALDGKGER